MEVIEPKSKSSFLDSLWNKGNSIILVTDSSCVTEKPWHENACMPYLEIFSAYYKQVANIDAYPIILDIGRITNSEVLCETVCAISPCYSGVEFFNVSEQRRKEFLELWKKSSFYNQFAYLDGCCKRDIDNCLKGKKTDITSNSIYAAIWRVLLDVHFTGDAPSSTALYSSYDNYVLVDDPTATWEGIWAGMVSSQLVAGYKHFTVYRNYLGWKGK